MATLSVTLVEDDYNSVQREWLLHLKSDEEHASPSFRLSSPYDTKKESELVWYLEQFANDPFAKTRASQITQDLRHYALVLVTAVEKHLVDLVLQHDSCPNYSAVQIGILGRGSESALQSVHWELLEDLDLWASLSRYTRRLTIMRLASSEAAVDELSQVSSRGIINILLVSARPRNIQEDIPYRLVSRKIWDLVQSSASLSSSIKIHFVRPGTFSELRRVLKQHGKGFFSIVHFDAHGLVGNMDRVAKLSFSIESNSSGNSAHKSARAVAELLHSVGVQNVVLNACNTANAGQPPASNLALEFTRHGIARVVAMTYAVKTDTASIFVRNLYKELLINMKGFPDAVAASRELLRCQKLRAAVYSVSIDLDDYFIPVLYQSHRASSQWRSVDQIMTLREKPTDQQFLMAAVAEMDTPIAAAPVTPDPLIEDSPCRDIDLLSIENLLAACMPVLVTGGGGCGKTSLAKHLQEWWKATGYAEEVFYFSMVSDKLSFLNDSIYDKAMDHVETLKSARSALHSSSYILILDDLPASGEEGSPLTTSSDREKFYGFLSRFSETGNRCKLLIFSRVVPEARIMEELEDYVQQHDLTVLGDEEAGQIAKYYLDFEIKKTKAAYSLPQTDAKDLLELIQFHDNNPFFIKVFVPVLSRTGQRPGELLSELQYNLPQPCFEALDDYLHEDRAAGSVPIRPYMLTAFRQGLRDYRQDYPLAYWIMLSLAPFQRRIPQDLQPWLHRLIINGVLVDESTEQFSEVQSSTTRFFDHEAWIEFTEHQPQFGITLEVVLEFLEATGLIKGETDISYGLAYWRLHPLLPYLLRHEILKQHEDSQKIMIALQTAFWEYADLRATALLEAPDLVQSQLTMAVMLEKEAHNIGNAVELCQIDTRFSKRMIFLCQMLRCLPLPRLSVRQLSYWQNVLDKLLDRYTLLVFEVPEEELQEYRCFPLAKRILADVVLLAYVRGSILHGYLHKYEAIEANAERAFRLREALAGEEEILPSLQATLLCFQFQRATIDKRPWEERQIEVTQLLAAPVPEGLSADETQIVKGARSGLIMKLLADARHGTFSSSTIDLGSLGAELQGTMAQVSQESVWRKAMPASFRLGSLAESISKWSTGGDDDQAFSTLVAETDRVLGKMPAFNAMTSWAKDFSYASGEGTFKSSIAERRKAFHLKLVEARDQRNSHQEHFYLKRLFDLALDEQDLEAATDRHEEILGLENNPTLRDIIPEQEMIADMSSRLSNLASILLNDKTGSTREKEVRLDTAHDYLAQAEDLLADVRTDTTSETLCQTALLRSSVCLARAELHVADPQTQFARAFVHVLRAARYAYLPHIPYVVAELASSKALEILLTLWASSPCRGKVEDLVGAELGWPAGQLSVFLAQLLEYVPVENDDISKDLWALIADEAQQALFSPDADSQGMNFLKKDEQGGWVMMINKKSLIGETNEAREGNVLELQAAQWSN